MVISVEQAIEIIEAAFPDILYKDMEKALRNLKKAGFFNCDIPKKELSSDNKKNNTLVETKFVKARVNSNRYSNKATPEEIEEWEKYNGKGSYSNNSSPRNSEEKYTVRDEKIFKSIFKKPEVGFTSKDDDKLPF